MVNLLLSFCSPAASLMAIVMGSEIINKQKYLTSVQLTLLFLEKKEEKQ